MSFSSGIFKCFKILRPMINEGKNLLCNRTSPPPKKFCSGSAKSESLAANDKRFIIMKLNSPQFQSCLTEEVFYIRRLLQSRGHEIKIVGGAVRDLLLGKKPEDLDFATTATPEEMKNMFTVEGVRLLNNNGEKHGTITPRINDKNFEITTLRIDVLTDGRRSKVEFTTDWLLDANRRDLTINAMYLDLDGNLYDYFNGYEDLKSHTVRFVGSPSVRIQEDYLRILRYFRFYGKISKAPDNHLQDTLDAIEQNVKGLDIISGERIWMELQKIVTGNFVYDILLEIIKLKVGSHIGFPKQCNISELKNVCSRLKIKGFSVKPITLLISIFNTEEELEDFFLRIKPSSYDRDLGFFILAYRNKNNDSPNRIRMYQHYVLTTKETTPKIAFEYCCELLKYLGEEDLLNEFKKWEIPKFPINGNHLLKKGVTGKKVGLIINKLKEVWIEHDFNIEIEELLEEIPNISSSLPEEKFEGKKSVTKNRLKN